MSRIREHLAKYMPAGTRITQPQGGFTLWLELPEGIDAIKLAEQALAENISIAAGPLFSACDKYKNCFRVSCAPP
ncbi:hypothetical protein [uncultured Zhongshania sp.]|uniref:hypothetical protein n=1 Tax=uncultured Zhongshania sp. TaxID=1642288 RepID=UPI0030DA5AE3|tara:strand:+ start:259 stop:483 length:225 start_codon:yes stop_codon:yes gene_type:complete